MNKVRSKTGKSLSDLSSFAKSNDQCWYLFASRTHGAIYERSLSKKPILIKELFNPSGAESERALNSDRPGRGYSSSPGRPVRHALDRRHRRREHGAVVFARSLSKILKEAELEKKFSSLVLVAEPHFLGILRSKLPKSVSKRVIKGTILAKEWDIFTQGLGLKG